MSKIKRHYVYSRKVSRMMKEELLYKAYENRLRNKVTI